MFNLFRSRLSAVGIIVVLSVAACCSSSEATGDCPDQPQAAGTQAAVGTDTDQSSDGMDMPMDMPTPTSASTSAPKANASTPPCSITNLTINDPEPPPLYPFIGSAHWHVPWGQDYFDQGLRFFYAFNYRESYRAFRAAADEADDRGIDCSACYWAQALPLGVDINKGTQSDPDRETAIIALHRAKKKRPNQEDDAIIEALLGRYQDCNGRDGKECQSDRNQAYYDGMHKVLDAYGNDDPNVITLFADSAMILSRGNYWDEEGNVAPGPIMEARSQLQRALQFNQYPPNEGPIHWYIHLMEKSPTPDLASQYADMLAPIAPSGPLAPNAGHLVHMAAHIYYRLGDMQKAVEANKAAIQADERYFDREPNLYRPDDDRYKYGFYPHNIYFLLAAAALSGDTKDRDVNHYAEKLLKWAPEKPDGFLADTFRTDYYMAKMNFSRIEDIRSFKKPGSFEQQPLANIAYDYTQLMAKIWDGQDFTQLAAEFKAHLDKFRASEKNEENPNCYPGLKRPNLNLCLAAILEELGDARMEASKKNWSAAIDAAERAKKIQDVLPYQEPPLWLYPASQTWASILIQKAIAQGQDQQDLAAAKQLLDNSLNGPSGGKFTPFKAGIFPGNGWAYYGLWEIAAQNGTEDERNKAKAELDSHWFGPDDFRKLERM